jgi:hypothetical protein
MGDDRLEEAASERDAVASQLRHGRTIGERHRLSSEFAQEQLIVCCATGRRIRPQALSRG